MKLKLEYDSWDEGSRGSLQIHAANTANDQLKLSFHDGEPEDNNLWRNFNDCYSIRALVEMAYEAGKRGEEFALEEIELENGEPKKE